MSEKEKSGVSSAKSKKRKASADQGDASLVEAACKISNMLCELSNERELFVLEASDKPERKLDAKALKEFSSVIKDMSTVICELKAASGEQDTQGVRIEFSDEALDMSS